VDRAAHWPCCWVGLSPLVRRRQRGLSEESSARTELFAEVVAALLELGDDRFLLLGLAEHQ
jgi:hypothetical protein